MTFLRLHTLAATLTAVFAVSSLPASAQVTNGSISGRVVDTQGLALPGVTVEATQDETGFNRVEATDLSGTYRLPALPIGTYVVRMRLSGFRVAESTVTVNVGVNLTLDVTMVLDEFQDTITVTEPPPPRTSGRGEVVDLDRPQPMNGRNFADLAGTVPGVLLGFHADPARSGQALPLISGGGGRGLFTMVDGGDNNDDTVGGPSQLFPLEAVRQFHLLTQRFDAEYGRGGSIMNVVTKSGTNAFRGSWFTQFRDDALNAATFSERLAGVEKQHYSRRQYGGSLGGPIALNRAHFFIAFERTQQDTRQLVDTGGIFPLEDGRIHDIPFRQNLFLAKVTVAPKSSQYLAVRYARDVNRQPSGAGRTAASTTWVTTTNEYDSLNVNYNVVSRRAALNEFLFQVSRYENDTVGGAPGPVLIFPGGVTGGANANAPQWTEQVKWQFRDDYSWSLAGAGLSHEIRTGVNWTHEPRLFVRNDGGTGGLYWMLGPDPNGPVRRLMLIGGTVSSNIPLDLFGLYVQDDWRVTDRLTLNLGVRWDYLKGMPIEQTSDNFQAMQAAGQAGRFEGTFLEDFGQSPRGDWDNIQPRLGAVYDLTGDGRTLVRGGWGIYTEATFTNSNVLTTSLEGGGIILSASHPAGLRKTDGSFFLPSDPIDSLGLSFISPTTGEVVSPRLEQPFSYQTNVGVTREITSATSLSVDYANVDVRDINMRVRPNVDTNPDPEIIDWYLGDLSLRPLDPSFRTAVSAGRSSYHALILSGRRRMTSGFDLHASYTLAKATSTVGSAYDEMVQNLIQDINDPFGEFQDGPSTRSDARHQVSVSSVVRLPLDVQVASAFFYRSALPITTLEGLDLNGDLNPNDHTSLAYEYAGLNDDGSARFDVAGDCPTVNCSRRAPFSQLNMRISRSFALVGNARIEAIAEVFNVFNAKNPNLGLSTQRFATLQDGTVINSPAFMQPTGYAGDAGQTEQRIGQLGFRITF